LNRVRCQQKQEKPSPDGFFVCASPTMQPIGVPMRSANDQNSSRRAL
jgi:hypothetical protein